ncbi:MAG: hypothetical protein ACK5JM_06745 [Rhodoblastus sp.]
MKVTGANLLGVAKMKNRYGAQVTYNVAGVAQDGNFALQRMRKDGGTACTYSGKAVEGRVIAGVMTCGADRAPWKVIRSN